MRDRQVTQHGDFQIATAIGHSEEYVSWGKMGIISGIDPVTEPGAYVWFQFGRTREEARNNLLSELGLT